MLGDRHYPRVRHHQHAAVNWCVRTREKDLYVIARRMLADSGSPLSVWGGLLMGAAYLKDGTPHKVLKMETPFKMLHGEDAHLSHLRLIILIVRTFVHSKDSRKLDYAA